VEDTPIAFSELVNSVVFGELVSSVLPFSGLYEVRKTAINASEIPVILKGVRVSLVSRAMVNRIGIITDIFAATVVVEIPTFSTLCPINRNMVIKIIPRRRDNGSQSDLRRSKEKGLLWLKKKPAEQAVM